jgi:hypothetical protein
MRADLDDKPIISTTNFNYDPLHSIIAQSDFHKSKQNGRSTINPKRRMKKAAPKKLELYAVNRVNRGL